MYARTYTAAEKAQIARIFSIAPAHAQRRLWKRLGSMSPEYSAMEAAWAALQGLKITTIGVMADYRPDMVGYARDEIRKGRMEMERLSVDPVDLWTNDDPAYTRDDITYMANNVPDHWC